MARKSFSETVSDARVMASGIEAKLEELSPIGLDASVADEFKALAARADEQNNKQEKLKAELKNCTAELANILDEISAKIVAAKKKIKAVIPQTEWKAFGIADKR